MRTLKLLLLAGATVGILLAATSSASRPIAAARLQTAEQFVQRVFLPLNVKPGLDLSVAEVKVIQGTSASPNYAVNVAGRATMVRVFVKTGRDGSVPGITGKLCGYDAKGSPLGCIPADNQPIGGPSSEKDLASTLNFSLPAQWLKPGSGYHVELDPENKIAEGNKDNNRYPLSGLRPFQFVSVPPIEVVIVPIEYRPFPGASNYLPQTHDLSYLTTLPIKLLPVAEINYQLRSSYLFAPNKSEENLDNREGKGWVKLLGDITAIHSMEDGSGSKNYYGLVNSYDAHNCVGGCITGIGWISTNGGGLRTAAGWSGWGAGSPAAGETFTHEVGHNFGMGHVPCTGNERNLELNYPYSGGKIGQFGLDLASGQLYDPNSFADYMSYCKPNWTSDYTFWKIFEYRKTYLSNVIFTEHAAEALYLSGTVSADGEVSLRPIYRQLARLPVSSEGSHRLELLGRDGEVLAVRAFDPVEMADVEAYHGFGFFIPALEGLEGVRVVANEQVLAEIYAAEQAQVLTASGGVLEGELGVDGKSLRWGAEGEGRQGVVYRLRLSRDGGQTWSVLALDLRESSYTLAQDWHFEQEEVWLEIQASDGFNTETRVYGLPASRSK